MSVKVRIDDFKAKYSFDPSELEEAKKKSLSDVRQSPDALSDELLVPTEPEPNTNPNKKVKFSETKIVKSF